MKLNWLMVVSWKSAGGLRLYVEIKNSRAVEERVHKCSRQLCYVCIASLLLINEVGMFPMKRNMLFMSAVPLRAKKETAENHTDLVTYPSSDAPVTPTSTPGLKLNPYEFSSPWLLFLFLKFF